MLCKDIFILTDHAFSALEVIVCLMGCNTSVLSNCNYNSSRERYQENLKQKLISRISPVTACLLSLSANTHTTLYCTLCN